jgi:multicomponent Na+:H+ antiporter subunit D
MAELWLHPALPMLVGAILVRFAPRRIGHVVMVAAPAIALVQVWLLGTDVSVGLRFLDFDLTVLRADDLARPFGVVFAVAGIIAGIYGITSQRAPERSAALAYAGAALGIVYAGDLLTLFLFWEIKAVASTFVTIGRGTHNAGRAGLRCLFFQIVGGKLLFAGALVQLSQTGSLAFDLFEPGAASTLVLLACLISAAVPLLHAWLPDAYPSAGVAGTVFLSAYTTKAAVYALARGFAGFDVLVWLGVVMALYGIVYAMLEDDIRRLLAYHIVSQVGFMVTGVGIGTEAAVNGAVAHAFAHILYKGLLLMGTGAVLYATGRSRSTELGGIANRMRPVLILYLIGAVSISSVPLFSGFTSKELVIDAASAGGLTAVLLLLKVASVGTFLSTGLKLPYATWFGADGAGPRTNTPGARLHVGRVATSMYVAMGLAAALNILLGLAPGLLYDLLPYPVDYTPYTLGKLVEKSQTLLFTGLMYWLLFDRFAPKATISIDVDWLYRKAPGLLRERVTRHRDAEAAPSTGDPAATVPTGERERIPTAPAAPTAPAGRTALLDRLEDAEREGEPPVPQTWVLGVVVLGVAVLLLLASLVP